jgi:hypothetical protein
MQEENGSLHNYVYSSEMVEFVRAASDYCQFLEQLQGVDGKAFIGGSVPLLAEVYRSVLKVPRTEPLYEYTSEPRVTEQEWSAIYKRMSMLLGAHNEYLRPAGESEYDRSDLITHTISEDMADLYQELGDFIAVYGRGMEEFINDAAWELLERFDAEWGMKLLNALHALHPLYGKGIDPDEEE